MFKRLILLSFLAFLANCSYNGIDISKWEGPNVDFKAVKKSGINFVIIRAGARKKIDIYYEKNYKKAKEAGLNVGAYWYSYASSIEDSTAEANVMLSALKGKKFEYPVYYDIEEKSIFDKGRDFTSAIARNFCNILQDKRYYCGIYASSSKFKSYFHTDVKRKYSIWVAQWASKCTYDEPYQVWQKTSKGTVPGISGKVDLDISYVNFPPIMKEKHLNGY